MAKVITLFGEEDIVEKNVQKETITALPLIPLSKKKASKNDTPLEKEMRRFNRLLKQISEYEEDQKKQQAYDDEYDRLYQQLLVPQIIILAGLKFEFAQHLHHIFSPAKFSKQEQRIFAELIINLLTAFPEFVPQGSKELAQIYMNLQIHLLGKREKAAFKDMMQEGGFDIKTMNDFDVQQMFEHNESRIEKEAFAHHMRNEKEKKAKAPEIEDISTLYKELAKQLHPDLEQNEEIRHRKEHLMKELSRAKKENDLFAMLLLKSKVKEVNGSDTSSAEYSLVQLKKYNKLLQQKHASLRDDFIEQQFAGYSLSNNGFITGHGNRSISPKQKIEEELADIHEQMQNAKEDIQNIQTESDARMMIEEIKQASKMFRVNFR